MDVINTSGKYEAKHKAVITMGNFDGVHLGHQQIIRKITHDARHLEIPSLLYTFEPHPAKVFIPDTGIKLLQTREQKLNTLNSLGVDICVVEKFDTKFATQSPEDFFKNVVLKKLKPHKIIIGHDFTFGKKRSGSIDTLKKMCADNKIEFELINSIFLDDVLISSTQIRNFISNGRISNANELLGRPYSICGTIIRGHGRGIKLGLHTANLETENELIPKEGVYITKTKIKDLTYPSASNIGKNPTFNDDKLSIETHIFDFDETLYGEKMEIEFIKYHRDEIKFKDGDELAAQIIKDIKEARFHYMKTKP